ncbi:hypothetical protein [Actinomadura sp. SCN-SB]|uniref:hypothetical protein n=1 Tax=Actinomadura sp. SCN-SB TaxID=3373092 RepID=UPI00374FEB1F
MLLRVIAEHATHTFHDILSLAPSPSPSPESGPDTANLARWIRDIFGPIFLVIVSIVAIFFLFTREITRFVQFVLLAIAIGVVFYVPNIIEVVAVAIANALGVE